MKGENVCQEGETIIGCPLQGAVSPCSGETKWIRWLEVTHVDIINQSAYTLCNVETENRYSHSTVGEGRKNNIVTLTRYRTE